ncbi:unnamed protein product [Rhizophagus irregularis]|nr:unnamed protein product [Rhizophagus irregularis]CAB4446493.1 unnamed protein product [Rhizophagus irregularis]
MDRLFRFEIQFASQVIHLKLMEVAFQNVVAGSEILPVAGRVQFPNGLISQGSLNAGYLRIAREKHCVHRLIALAFCPKGRGKEYVNHIDGNRTNNKASNLEWCTQKENSQHAIQLGLWGNCNQHAVKQIFDDNSTQEFPSLTEAQRITGIHRSCIWRVCQGLQNHAGACRWEYVSTISHNNHEDSSQ